MHEFHIFYNTTWMSMCDYYYKNVLKLYAAFCFIVIINSAVTLAIPFSTVFIIVYSVLLNGSYVDFVRC